MSIYIAHRRRKTSNVLDTLVLSEQECFRLVPVSVTWVTSNPEFKVMNYATSSNSTNSKLYVIYRVEPFPKTLSDPLPRFQGHRVTTDALDILCAQLRCNLLAIAKFLVINKKLSCRRETAQCFTSLKISLSHTRSLNFIQNDTVLKLGYSFLFAFRGNYGS